MFPIHTDKGIYYPTDLETLDFSSFQGQSFLDLGSGFGDLVEYANNQGLNARGIEIEPFFYEHSKAKDKITLGDMFDMEWNADILFYYIAGTRREDELIDRLRQSNSLIIINTAGLPNFYIEKFRVLNALFI